MEAEAGPSRASQDPIEQPPNAENGTDADGLPPNASETLYLHNLNEKVRIPGTFLLLRRRQADRQ